LIPKTLRPGADPNIHGNWYVWGYRFISRCSLDTAGLFLSTNLSKYYLPDDWGFDVLPCYKLSPMDCFQEGKVFDYPQALQQLEQLGALKFLK
jgi:patched 1 protein/patched 2 protein